MAASDAAEGASGRAAGPLGTFHWMSLGGGRGQGRGGEGKERVEEGDTDR